MGRPNSCYFRCTDLFGLEKGKDRNSVNFRSSSVAAAFWRLCQALRIDSRQSCMWEIALPIFNIDKGQAQLRHFDFPPEGVLVVISSDDIFHGCTQEEI